MISYPYDKWSGKVYVKVTTPSPLSTPRAVIVTVPGATATKSPPWRHPYKRDAIHMRHQPYRDHFVYAPANERRRYIVTSSLIGRAHTQNDPCHNLSFLNSYNPINLVFETQLRNPPLDSNHSYYSHVVVVRFDEFAHNPVQENQLLLEKHNTYIRIVFHTMCEDLMLQLRLMRI